MRATRSPHSGPRKSDRASPTSPPRHGLARVLSRLGVCSRSEAARRIVSGRVRVNGRLVRNPEVPTNLATDLIEMDGQPLQARARIYLAVNKPRGLVVSTSDERGRDTIYALLQSADLPWLAPVGRLDKASEGLLLMSNDPVWASGVTEPDAQILKTYRVQVRGVVDDATLQRLRAGVMDRGEYLSAESVWAIGGGEKNTWLEIMLAEGRNRQLRRMLSACSHDVLRLIRIAIGSLELGDLPKGAWRRLSEAEILDLSGALPNARITETSDVKPPRRLRRSRSPSHAARDRPP